MAIFDVDGKYSEVCKQYKQLMGQSEAVFRCLSCCCEMHLNECAGLSKNLFKAIQELGSNILLLCNECVEVGRQDAIVEGEASPRWEEKNEDKLDFG